MLLLAGEEAGGPLHTDLKTLLEQYDINAAAASVKVYAIKGGTGARSTAYSWRGCRVLRDRQNAGILRCAQNDNFRGRTEGQNDDFMFEEI